MRYLQKYFVTKESCPQRQIITGSVSLLDCWCGCTFSCRAGDAINEAGAYTSNPLRLWRQNVLESSIRKKIVSHKKNPDSFRKTELALCIGRVNEMRCKYVFVRLGQCNMRRSMLWYYMPAIICCAMICYVMLCYAMLRYAMLCVHHELIDDLVW